MSEIQETCVHRRENYNTERPALRLFHTRNLLLVKAPSGLPHYACSNWYYQSFIASQMGNEDASMVYEGSHSAQFEHKEWRIITSHNTSLVRRYSITASGTKFIFKVNSIHFNSRRGIDNIEKLILELELWNRYFHPIVDLSSKIKKLDDQTLIWNKI